MNLKNLKIGQTKVSSAKGPPQIREKKPTGIVKDIADLGKKLSKLIDSVESYNVGPASTALKNAEKSLGAAKDALNKAFKKRTS